MLQMKKPRVIYADFHQLSMRTYIRVISHSIKEVFLLRGPQESSHFLSLIANSMNMISLLTPFHNAKIMLEDLNILFTR